MMNLPNILTLSRIGFAVIISYFLLQQNLCADVVAAVCFVVAALTDLYDGYLARQMKLASSFGKIMDPIADKILMLSVFLTLSILGMVAWWMLVIIAAREILVTADRLFAMRSGRVLAAERAGKIKTTVQMVSVGIILLYLIVQQCPSLEAWFSSVQNAWLTLINGLMLMVVFITVVSGVAYFRSKLDIHRRSI